MIKEYYLDLDDDTGQIGITGLRGSSCGEVIDPVILQNRLDPTPNLLHVVGRGNMLNGSITVVQIVKIGTAMGMMASPATHHLSVPHGSPDRK